MVGPFDASILDAIAAKIAIKFSLELGFWDVHLEGDARIVMAALEKPGANFLMSVKLLSAQN